MPRRQGKQERLFDEKLDEPIVKAADRVIELRKEKAAVKERLEIQEKNLIGLMKKTNRSRIHHGGFIIEVSMTDPKEKLKFKEPKKGKSDG